MKIRDYENHVQVVDILQDRVRVKLVTEAGDEIGGLHNCIDVPIEKIPINRRNYGERLRLRWRAIDSAVDDTESEVRNALASAFEFLD